MVGVLVAAVLVVCGCTPAEDQALAARPADAQPVITVGSFDFPESRLLAELYAQALEGDGYQVRRLFDIGSRELVEPALEQGLVDVVPEYVGSALNFLERRADAATFDTVATHRRLVRAFARRGVTVADPAPAQNRNAVAVRRDVAQRHDLRRVSDLGAIDHRLVLGGPPECPERDACMRGLQSRYGLEFAEFHPLEQPRHVAAALEAGEIDVAVLFTSDPAAGGRQVVVLRDDRRLQPAENIVPAVRTAVVREHGPRVVEVLESVGRRLTTVQLAGLNGAVELDREPEAAVAAQWLAGHGLDVAPIAQTGGRP